MTENKNQNKWLTKKDLTRYLPISLRSIENYVKKGLFVAHRLGGKILFNIEQIDEAIQNSATPLMTRFTKTNDKSL
jgi:hypothetical protein